MTGLRAFEAFARLGAMTAAADELCVTHGAISRQVRALEARLCVPLVSGPRHDLRLTDAGRTLASALTQAFDIVAGGLPGTGPSTELVVSCLGTLAMKWLIPRLPTFLERQPRTRVRIIESHAPVDFSQGGVHAAIRIEQGRTPEGVISTPFMAHAHGPVLAPSVFAEIDRDPRRLLELPRLHSETFRAAWDSWALHAAVALPKSALDREFEHNSYVLEAAAAGLGVAVAPWAFAASDIERGRLVAPLGFASVQDRFVLLRPKLSRNDLVDEFGAWLQEEASRTPPAPAPQRFS
jgi:DNA-binding transcriptional LysR family regulator